VNSPPTRAALAIALVLTAVFMFASMDATSKHLAQNWPIPFILWARYVINFLLIILIFAPRHGWALVKTNRTGLVILRGVALASSSTFAVLALHAMPVAETTAIIYLAPFGVMLLSGPLLGERVRLAGWIATGFGFMGLLLITRPGSGLSTLGILFGICTAIGTMTYHMMSRGLAKTESTMAMLFHSSWVGAVIFSAFLPWSWPGAVPQGLDAGLLIGMGFISTLGHSLFTAGYREAPISLLTPINYAQLIWAALLGWLIFNHLPDGLTMAGIALVAAAGAGNALWSHFFRLPTQIIEPEEV
jgi:drug/metabolite transporter (DMT)-like permease